MGIHRKTIIHVICETEEENENNTSQNCYISDDFNNEYEATRAGWVLMPNGRTLCPYCKCYSE